MKKLSDDLKRMLNGLAYQDVGEYLPRRDMMKALGMTSENKVSHSPTPSTITLKTTAHSVALITDGRGAGAPLAYAIDACSRQGANLDLLTHGAFDSASLRAMENQIRAAGLGCHRIHLGMKPVDEIINYICNHPSVMFLVAMPDDVAAKEIVEYVIPKRGGRIPTPLVLIEDRPSASQAEQPAA